MNGREQPSTVIFALGGAIDDYGRFGWVIGPEGRKVELWQPPPGQ